MNILDLSSKAFGVLLISVGLVVLVNIVMLWLGISSPTNAWKIFMAMIISSGAGVFFLYQWAEDYLESWERYRERRIKLWRQAKVFDDHLKKGETSLRKPQMNCELKKQELRNLIKPQLSKIGTMLLRVLINKSEFKKIKRDHNYPGRVA